jgi:hypothetical protein
MLITLLRTDESHVTSGMVKSRHKRALIHGRTGASHYAEYRVPNVNSRLAGLADALDSRASVTARKYLIIRHRPKPLPFFAFLAFL